MKKSIMLVVGIIVLLVLLSSQKKEYKKGAGIYVQFRTTDLSYSSDSAIGFTETCGSDLTRYGYTGNTPQSSGTCSDDMPTETDCDDATLLLTGLPGGYYAGGESPSLWRSSFTTVCVCDDDGSHYRILLYKTTGFYASKVDSSPNPITPSNEVACGTCDCASGPCCDGCSYMPSESQPVAYSDANLCVSDKAYVHDYYCSGTDSAYHERDTLVEDCPLTGKICQGGVCIQSCSCASWVDGNCGIGICSPLERQGIRICAPSGCDLEERCVEDASCAASCPNVCSDDTVSFDEYITIGNKWLNG